MFSSQPWCFSVLVTCLTPRCHPHPIFHACSIIFHCSHQQRKTSCTNLPGQSHHPNRCRRRRLAQSCHRKWPRCPSPQENFCGPLWTEFAKGRSRSRRFEICQNQDTFFCTISGLGTRTAGTPAGAYRL